MAATAIFLGDLTKGERQFTASLVKHAVDNSAYSVKFTKRAKVIEGTIIFKPFKSTVIKPVDIPNADPPADSYTIPEPSKAVKQPETKQSKPKLSYADAARAKPAVPRARPQRPAPCKAAPQVNKNSLSATTDGSSKRARDKPDSPSPSTSPPSSKYSASEPDDEFVAMDTELDIHRWTPTLCRLPSTRRAGSQAAVKPALSLPYTHRSPIRTHGTGT